MSECVIYHGTPITPRAALLDIMPGRAACVSFFRPDDMEAVEAECPKIMFRQRGIFVLDGRAQSGSRMGRHATRLALVLRLVGAAPDGRAMGGYSRRARSAVPAQRCSSERLAFWPTFGRPALAYGRANRATGAALRAIRNGCAGLDWRPQERAGRVSALSRANGRGGGAFWQSLAVASHDARDSRGFRLPVRQRRRDLSSPKWASI